MSDLIIKSFEDLHRMVMSHQNGHFIYRGEDRSNYKLRPKVGRYLPRKYTDSVRLEQFLLEEFKRRSAPHIITQPLPSNDLEWMAVAQHFGLATRLLDWTQNPLVAAYFATSGAQENDRVVYAINKSTISQATSPSPFDINDVVMYEPKHIATRITAQTGLFTVHPQTRKVFETENLERWVITGEAVLDITISLNSYGFNVSTMFPGLDGIASHINDWTLGRVDHGP